MFFNADTAREDRRAQIDSKEWSGPEDWDEWTTEEQDDFIAKGQQAYLDAVYRVPTDEEAE